jgi:ribosomal protein L37AE/L43A
MAYKVCTLCNQTSYSSAERDIWLCPYCGKDITFQEGFSHAEYRKYQASFKERAVPPLTRLPRPDDRK